MHGQQLHAPAQRLAHLLCELGAFLAARPRGAGEVEQKVLALFELGEWKRGVSGRLLWTESLERVAFLGGGGEKGHRACS